MGSVPDLVPILLLIIITLYSYSNISPFLISPGVLAVPISRNRWKPGALYYSKTHWIPLRTSLAVGPPRLAGGIVCSCPQLFLVIMNAIYLLMLFPYQPALLATPRPVLRRHLGWYQIIYNGLVFHMSMQLFSFLVRTHEISPQLPIQQSFSLLMLLF